MVTIAVTEDAKEKSLKGASELQIKFGQSTIEFGTCQKMTRKEESQAPKKSKKYDCG